MMEPDSMGGIIARVTRVEKDIETNATYRHEMRSEMGEQSSKLAVLAVKQGEIKEDIDEVKDQLKWVLRGLVGAIITFTGLIVTIVVAVFNHG